MAYDYSCVDNISIYLQDYWRITSSQEKVTFVLSFDGARSPQNLKRVDISYQEQDGAIPRSAEYYPDGRLYAAETFQGQYRITGQDRIGVANAIDSLIEQLRVPESGIFMLLSCVTDKLRTLPLLQPGQGR